MRKTTRRVVVTIEIESSASMKWLRSYYRDPWGLTGPGKVNQVQVNVIKPPPKRQRRKPKAS